MSNAYFLTIQSTSSTGVLGALPRIPVLVTREAVSGFTPDPVTGLYKINSTDVDTFEAANATKYGLLNAFRVVFNQNYSYPYVYVLSNTTGVTSANLDDANKRPRDWSFLTIVDRYNGDGTGGTSANYFTDLGVIKTWDPLANEKICIHTYSVEESSSVITLPTELQLGGSIGSDPGFKTIVSNDKSVIATVSVTPIYAYNNIALALLSYVINGPAVSRSWGSLSDAHDFLGIDEDTYSNASRSIIANASLAQYNGAKDRAGSKFVYDTQMNAEESPPLTAQIESITAEQYIKDYTYVLVHNSLQAAGETGVPNDDRGIQRLLGLTRQALSDCFDLNLILAKADGSPDFAVGTKTAAQVTLISPNWKVAGVWPSGVITATIKPFGAAHYATIDFAF